MTDLSVDVVFLDAGGVLVVPTHDVICERFAAAYGDDAASEVAPHISCPRP